MKQKLRKFMGIPHLGQEKGQSLVIMAFSFIGLIALLGLGLDLGLVYVERTSLKRAIDAAVLSGVSELSNEEEAGIRAIEYLALNGYDLDDTNVYFKGCLRDKEDLYDTGGAPVPDGNTNHLINAADWYPYLIANEDDVQVTNVFWINTYFSQEDGNCYNPMSDGLLGDATEIAMTGTVKVDMNFFALLGRGDVPVTDHAIAQNVDSLDMVVVLDKSGSMQFNPVCYGCWERTETPNVTDDPPYWNYTDYPANGVIYPIGYSSSFEDATGLACTAEGDSGFDVNATVFRQGGFNHIIMEAELYSLNDSPPDLETQTQGQGFWSLQRGESDYNSQSFIPSQGTSVDAKGAHMAHHPSLTVFDNVIYGRHYTWAEAQAGESPGLHYAFKFYNLSGTDNDWDDEFYIWARVHAGRGLHYATTGSGGGMADQHSDGNDEAYWQVNTVNADFPYTPTSSGSVERFEVNESSNGTENGYASYWRWVRLDPTDSLSGANSNDYTNTYEFMFYAGSTGYSIDRIVITDNWDDDGAGTSSNPGGNGSELDYGNSSQDARLAGPTMASAKWQACDICNPIFGQEITDPSVCEYYNLTQAQDNRTHALFDDWEMPMRATKEAIKYITYRLNPKKDQLGLVTYSSTSTDKTELACKRAATTQGTLCATDNTEDIDYHEIRKAVEDTQSGGTTPTAGGIKAGMEVLGIDPGEIGINKNCANMADSSCAQGGSQKVIILMTDGAPTQTFGGSESYGYNCTSSNSPSWSVANTANYRCPLYYAREAAQNGVVLYTVAVGFGADQPYLNEVARLGNGESYISPTGGDLPLILENLLANAFIRLIE